MPSEFHNRHPPPPLVRIFYIFMKPFEIICRVHNMPNFAYFMAKYFEWLFFCIQYSCMVTEGVIMTLGNKIVKRMKVLSLWACSTRHATYINFSLLQTGTSTCDECVYATLKIFRSSGRSSFHFCQLEIEPSGSAVTPNSTVGASYMVSKYQLKGIVGRKTMFCTDWTILCRRLLLREKKMMFCSIKASGAWCARNHLFYFVSCFHSHHRVVSSCTTPPAPPPRDCHMPSEFHRQPFQFKEFCLALWNPKSSLWYGWIFYGIFHCLSLVICFTTL